MAGAPLANLGVNAVNPNGDIAGVVAAGQMFGQLAQTRMRIAAQQSAQAFGAGMDFFRAEQNAILSEQRAKNSLAQRFGFDEWGKMSEAANAVGQPLNEYMANLDARRGEILNRQQVADDVVRLNTIRPIEMNYEFVRGEALAASAQLRKAADAKLQFASPEAKSQYQALNAQFGQILSDPANQTANAGEIRQLFQNVQQQQAQLLATIPDPPKSIGQRWAEATTPEQRNQVANEHFQTIYDQKTKQPMGMAIFDPDGQRPTFMPLNKIGREPMHPLAEALFSGTPQEAEAAQERIRRATVPIGNMGAMLTPVIKGNKIEFEVVKPTGGGASGSSAAGEEIDGRATVAGAKVTSNDVFKLAESFTGGGWPMYEAQVENWVADENRKRVRSGNQPMTEDEANAFRADKLAQPLIKAQNILKSAMPIEIMQRPENAPAPAAQQAQAMKRQEAEAQRAAAVAEIKELSRKIMADPTSRASQNDRIRMAELKSRAQKLDAMLRGAP